MVLAIFVFVPQIKEQKKNCSQSYDFPEEKVLFLNRAAIYDTFFHNTIRTSIQAPGYDTR